MDSIISFEEDKFSDASVLSAHKIFEKYKRDGIITGEYEDPVWTIAQDNKNYNINFQISKEYALSDLHVDKAGFVERLKAFVVHCELSYFAAATIGNHIIYIQRIFLRDGWVVPGTTTCVHAVIRFLDFLDVDHVSEFLGRVKEITPDRGDHRRHMAHMMVYLILADAIEKLYMSPDLDDESFVYYFPVYFWIMLTFRLPLRVTETLYTPYDCLHIQDGVYSIECVRSKIKNGVAHKDKIHYNEADYKHYTYVIPYSSLTENITKYQKLTANHKRKFLFLPRGRKKFFTVTDLIYRIDSFMAYVEKSKDYDFARYVIPDLDMVVRPGDARVIAMSTLFAQGISADMCRQLAGHTDIITSEHYFSNSMDTLWCSAVMQMQQRINKGMDAINDAKNKLGNNNTLDAGDYCTNPARKLDSYNISYCVDTGHAADCLGCRYFIYTKEYLEHYIKNETEKIKDAVDKLQDEIRKMDNAKAINRAALDYQTACARYTQAVNAKLEEDYARWVDQKSTTQTL